MQVQPVPQRMAAEASTRRLDCLPDPRLRDVARYWFARCAPGSVPLRLDIEPTDLKPVLPNLMLLDRLLQGRRARYRFRLAGTAVVDSAGRELTGKFLDEVLPGTYSDFVHGLNDLAIEQRLPVYSSSLYHDEGNVTNALTYRLVMPLNHAGGGPDMIMACQFWQRRTEPGHWSGDWQMVEPEIAVIARP